MTRYLFVVRSLFFFWRVNLAVCLGVVAATAVLTGALLVGDSMRGSLRKISLDGLGNVDEILLTDRFFREQLAEEIQANDAEVPIAVQRIQDNRLLGQLQPLTLCHLVTSHRMSQCASEPLS